VAEKSMSSTTNITFVAAVNNRELLKTNLLASPCLRDAHGHQVIVQENFSSAAKAYNDAIRSSVNDLIVFCHQDIVFPEYWLPQLQDTLDWLRVNDPEWGVLGCYGKTGDGRGWGHLYSSGRGVIGSPLGHPVRIQTLDEIVLILRTSSGLQFNEYLTNFHLYGADICLTAAERGMNSYAIPGFCIHNTRQSLVLPGEFYKCCKEFRRVWRHRLPIHSPTITINASNLPVWTRRVKEVWLRIRGKTLGASREADVQSLLAKFAVEPAECSIGVGLSFFTRLGWRLRKQFQPQV
jgi:hypothetical protein